jgi:hypothetical protein
MAITVEISKRLVLVNSVSSVVMRILNISVLLWCTVPSRRIQPEEFAVCCGDCRDGLRSAVQFLPLRAGCRYVVEACARDDEVGATTIVSSIFPVLLAWGLIFIAEAGSSLGISVQFSILLRTLEWSPYHDGVAGNRLYDPSYCNPVHCRLRCAPKYLFLNLIQLGVTLYRMGYYSYCYSGVVLARGG